MLTYEDLLVNRSIHKTFSLTSPKNKRCGGTLNFQTVKHRNCIGGHLKSHFRGLTRKAELLLEQLC